jgi:hypothetical protein
MRCDDIVKGVFRGDIVGNNEMEFASLVLSYYSCGQQVVQITEDMYDLLLRTDLTGVTEDDVRLPYPCMFFSMPESRRGAVGLAAPRRDISSGGIYLRNYSHYEVPGEILDKIGIDDGEHGSFQTAELDRLLASNGVSDQDLQNSQRNTVTLHAGSIIEDYTMTAELPTVVDNWFIMGRKERAMAGGVAALVDSMEGKPYNFGKAFIDMVRVAINAVVYLNHGLDTKFIQRRDNRAVEQFTKLFHGTSSKSKRHTYGRKITRIARPTVQVLGPNIKRGPSSTLATDVLVRGHWHTYWTGKGRSNRKLNWVQPHIRNKSKGISVSGEPRVYEI